MINFIWQYETVRIVLSLLLVLFILGTIYFHKNIKQTMTLKTLLKMTEQVKKPTVFFKHHKGHFYLIGANEAYFHMMGQRDLIGKSIEEMGHLERAKGHHLLLKEVLRTGENKEVEEVVTEHQTETYVKLYCSIMRFNRQARYFSIMLDDVSHYKQKQKQLEVISNRLSNAMALAKHIGFVEINKDKQTVWFSHYFFKLFELSSEDSFGRILTYQEVNEMCIGLDLKVDGKRARHLAFFLLAGDKRVSCRLPISKKQVFFELETMSSQNECAYISIVDVTEKTEETRLLKNKLKYDALTGLLNRDYLDEEIRVLIKQYPENFGFLMYIDIEKFKKINNHHGYAFGNKVIKEFSKLLNQKIHAISPHIKAVLARRAGDEFCVYVHFIHQTTISEAYILSLLSDVIDFDVVIEGLSISFRVNIGISIYNKDTKDLATLFEYADFSTQEVKKNILYQVSFYNHVQYEKEKEKSLLVNNLGNIIHNRDWEHVYQPILDFNSVSYLGYEVLARPKSVDIKQLIELAYEVGVYKQLELALYVSSLEDFQKKGRTDKYVSINEGPFDIFEGQNDLLQSITDFIETNKLKTIVEITEYARMNLMEVQCKIDRIRQSSTKVAIDDFGSGYANELALLALSPSYIKIDRGLIENIDQDERKQMLVSNIVRYAGKDVFVIAEGIETREELTKVIELGLNGAQGYYIQKPHKDLKDIHFELVQEVNEIKLATA